MKFNFFSIDGLRRVLSNSAKTGRKLITHCAILLAFFYSGLVAAEPLVVLMAPTGDDNNDGLTLDTPIKTLKRAQTVIADYINQHGHQNVQVRIGPGKYLGQTVKWTTTMPDHSITFMPLFDDKVRPVFSGNGECGTWFRLSHALGEKTNLIFRYIWVEDYHTAISLNGNRNADWKSNNANQIFGMYFKRIGNISCPHKGASTAAVRLVNSDNNDISNNHFVDIINANECGRLHALYMAHGSDDNTIRANRFVNNCGDPIRLRDYSNRNYIHKNSLHSTGVIAAYTDWYCDNEVRADCTKIAPECPSWDNQFRNNSFGSNYSGNRLKAFHYFQDDFTAGCEKPTPTSKRLRTSGNIRR